MSYQNDQVIKWAIESIQQDYPDDVSLLLLYGSYENGTANHFSDVDFYFIPKTERAYELCQTFIINEVGYDLFPMSWERVAGLAELNESLIPCLGDVKILYAQSEADEQRFKDLQLTLHQHLNDKFFMLFKANERVKEAKQLIGELILSNSIGPMRLVAGSILLKLAECVAFANQTYFHRGIKTQLEDLKQMRFLPLHFLDLYEFIIETSSEQDLQIACIALLKSTEFFLAPQQMKREEVNQDQLSGRYEELCSSFNKIYTQCQLNNKTLVFLSAIGVAQELNAITSEFNLPPLKLLNFFDSSNLDDFSKKTLAIENQLLSYLDELGVQIRTYPTINDFVEKQTFARKG